MFNGVLINIIFTLLYIASLVSVIFISKKNMDKLIPIIETKLKKDFNSISKFQKTSCLLCVCYIGFWIVSILFAVFLAIMI